MPRSLWGDGGFIRAGFDVARLTKGVAVGFACCASFSRKDGLLAEVKTVP